MVKKTAGKITYSCGVQGCCPTIEVRGEDVVLTDDFRNVARMTKAQLISLARATLKKLVT